MAVTTTDTPGHRNLIKNMTAGASRSSTLLRMEQTYNDVNKMDHDTAGYEQEWCEETSNEMKNILIKVEQRKEFIETNTLKIPPLKEVPTRMMPIDVFFYLATRLN